MTELLKKEEKDREKNDSNLDLIALLQKIYKAKNQIIKLVFVFMFFGLVFAMLSEEEYTASTTIVPQSVTKSSGGLTGLAALAGVNLGSIGESSSISPQLYPRIINNISFQKELLKTQIRVNSEESKISYKSYYTSIYRPSFFSVIKKYTIGLPSLIISSIGNKSKRENLNKVNPLINLTNEDAKLIDLLKSQLILDVNSTDGYITIRASMPEAKAAADLVKSTQDLLEKYVIGFKIEKSMSQLEFIKTRYLEKEIEFIKIQEELTTYLDKNKFISSERGKVELNKLQSQYDLIYGLYSDLAKQLEAQEIKVKEDTPVFTIIEPVFVPLKRAKPKRILILFTFIFFGIILSVSYVIIKAPILKIYREIKTPQEVI